MAVLPSSMRMYQHSRNTESRTFKCVNMNYVVESRGFRIYLMKMHSMQRCPCYTSKFIRATI